MLTPSAGLSNAQRRKHVFSIDLSGMMSLFHWVGCLQRALTCLAKPACLLAARPGDVPAHVGSCRADSSWAWMRADQRVTCRFVKAKTCLLALHASHLAPRILSSSPLTPLALPLGACLDDSV